MERRKVIKGIAAAVGIDWVNHRMSALGLDQTLTEKSSFAIPIRALGDKGGKLVQPIQLTIEHAGTDATLVVSVNRQEGESRVLSPGTHTFNVYVDPVETAQHMLVEYEIDGRSESVEVRVEPVRKLLIFILPHSHHDLGYTDLQSNVEKKQMANISRGIELARNTANYPPGARFVWNLEVLWGADLFMRTKTVPEHPDLFCSITMGWVGLFTSSTNSL